MGIILDGILDVWRADRGDPDLLGWVTTVAYLLAGAFCAQTAITARHSRTADTPRVDSRPYFALSSGLILLGLNKQLDLQILVRELGITLIRLLGREEHRRWFGRAFVLVMTIILLRIMAGAVRHLRGHTRGHRLLLAGLALLACFAVARAGTYVPGLKQINLRYGQALHLTFELGGIVLVAVGARRTRQRLLRHQSSSINSA